MDGRAGAWKWVWEGQLLVRVVRAKEGPVAQFDHDTTPHSAQHILSQERVRMLVEVGGDEDIGPVVEFLVGQLQGLWRRCGDEVLITLDR